MNIPIVMASNDSYAPALGVAILSMLAHRGSGDTYELNILYTELSHPNVERLERLSSSGFSVRCIKIYPPELPETEGWISKETYYRLLAAELLPQYEKLLYLDCDLIVLSDLALLYARDLGDRLVGAVCDYRFDGGYAQRVLGVPTNSYINAGVMLINAAHWRQEGIAGQCLDFLREGRPLEAYDQDAVNFVCRGRIMLLEKQWNFQQVWPEIYCWHPRHIEFRKNASLQEGEAFEFGGRGILHYVCAEKPWQHPQRELSEYFWSYARGSVFYEMLLRSASSNKARPGALARGAACLREHGLRYTLKRALVKISGRRMP